MLMLFWKVVIATSLMLNSWIFFQEGGTKCSRCEIIILTLYLCRPFEAVLVVLNKVLCFFPLLNLKVWVKTKLIYCLDFAGIICSWLVISVYREKFSWPGLGRSWPPWSTQWRTYGAGHCFHRFNTQCPGLSENIFWYSCEFVLTILEKKRCLLIWKWKGLEKYSVTKMTCHDFSKCSPLVIPISPISVGKSWQDKVREVRATLAKKKADVMVVTALDEIACKNCLMTLTVISNLLYVEERA